MMTAEEERKIYRIFGLLELGDYVLFSEDDYITVEVQDQYSEEIISFKIKRDSL